MLKRCLFTVSALLVAGLWTASAEEPLTVPAELQFKNAYAMLVQGDEARDNGKVTEATTLYHSALDSYRKLAARYPNWQPGVVKFRIAYCNTQLETLVKTLDGAERAAVRDHDAPDRSPSPPPPPPSSPAVALSPADARREASRLMAAGQNEPARRILLDALKQAPDDLSLRLMIGVAQCQAGAYEDASYVAGSILGDFPSNAIAYLVVGTVDFAQGRLEKAGSELRRAIELDPTLAEAHYDLARLLLLQRPPDLANAAVHYRKALELGLPADDSLAFLVK